jgi:hypothetical protein
MALRCVKSFLAAAMVMALNGRCWFESLTRNSLRTGSRRRLLAESGTSGLRSLRRQSGRLSERSIPVTVGNTTREYATFLRTPVMKRIK